MTKVKDNDVSERVPLEQAAAELGMNPQSLREYMKRGLMDVGVVMPSINGSGRRQYFVFRSKLDKYLGRGELNE